MWTPSRPIEQRPVEQLGDWKHPGFGQKYIGSWMLIDQQMWISYMILHAKIVIEPVFRTKDGSKCTGNPWKRSCDTQTCWHTSTSGFQNPKLEIEEHKLNHQFVTIHVHRNMPSAVGCIRLGSIQNPVFVGATCPFLCWLCASLCVCWMYSYRHWKVFGVDPEISSSRW